MLKLEGYLQSRGPVSPEQTLSQSYGDMQVPLLLFSPEGLRCYVCAIQKFAFDAHPVQRSLGHTPPHCYFVYRSKPPARKQYESSTSIASSVPKQCKDDIKMVTVPPSISNLSVIDWNSLNIHQQLSPLANLQIHSANQTRDLETSSTSSQSLSISSRNVSSNFSSEDLAADQEVGADGFAKKLSQEEEELRHILMSVRSPAFIESSEDLESSATDSELESVFLDLSSCSK